MLEKIEKLQILTLGVLIAISLVISTQIASNTIAKDVIFVTGSAYEIVKSDSGTLNFGISVKRNTKQEAYQVMQTHKQIVENYLKNKGIESIESKPVNGYYSYKRDAKTGAYTEIPESYNLTLPMTISSTKVELIKNISNDITGLINKGVDIMNKFEPDCIIALGGGSAIDAAKN